MTPGPMEKFCTFRRGSDIRSERNRWADHYMMIGRPRGHPCEMPGQNQPGPGSGTEGLAQLAARLPEVDETRSGEVGTAAP